MDSNGRLGRCAAGPHPEIRWRGGVPRDHAFERPAVWTDDDESGFASAPMALPAPPSGHATATDREKKPAASNERSARQTWRH
jgi:hypothetical protein